MTLGTVGIENNGFYAFFLFVFVLSDYLECTCHSWYIGLHIQSSINMFNMYIMHVFCSGADGTEAFKSKLKFQIQHEVFRSEVDHEEGGVDWLKNTCWTKRIFLSTFISAAISQSRQKFISTLISTQGKSSGRKNRGDNWDFSLVPHLHDFGLASYLHYQSSSSHHQHMNDHQVWIYQRRHPGSSWRRNQVNWSIRGVALSHLLQSNKKTTLKAFFCRDAGQIKAAEKTIMITYLPQNLLRAIENIGIVSVYGIRYLSTGIVTQQNFIK